MSLLHLPLSDNPPASQASTAEFSAEELRPLSEFVAGNSANFRPALHQPAQAMRRLVTRLSRPAGDLPDGLGLLCLRALRLACRHRPNLDACPAELLDACLICLMARAGISATPPADEQEVTESLMCLCNLCIQLDSLTDRLAGMRCSAGLLQRVSKYTPADLDKDWPVYDLRLLFLMAAKCEEARRELRHSLGGVSQLTGTLELLAATCGTDDAQRLVDRRCDLLGDLLKLLYALTASSGAGAVERGALVDGEEVAFRRLTALLRQLLLWECISPEKRDRLLQHCTSLLLCLPGSCYDLLLTDEETAESAAQSVFEGKGVDAIDILLAFLDSRLLLFAQSCESDAVATPQPSGVPVTGGAMENLVPVLSALYECCRWCRGIRRYCKARMLPKRTQEELQNLPEEGTSTGSRLCRVLTHPCTQAADMAACLVHAMCKQSLARCVRHTGYGNFAGFLARRGLMATMGGAGGDDGGGSTVCSSDSSGSNDDDGGEELENEEEASPELFYNPITGRHEPPRPDPTAGMTDEQKEYEVHKVMLAIDRLQATGVISPAVIGEDGRPCPVTHPLELVHRLAEQARRGHRGGGRRRDGEDESGDESGDNN